MNPIPMNQHPLFHSDVAHTDVLSSLRTLARDLIVDPDEAENVAEDALTKAAAKGAEAVSDVRSYAHGIVRFAAKRLRRDASTRRFHERRSGTNRAQRVHASPDETLERVELMRIVLQEIERLPPAQSRAVALRFLEERTVAEIAESEGSAPSTVRSQLSRGLAVIREALDTRFEGRGAWSLVLAPWALDPAFVAGEAARTISPLTTPAAATAAGALTTFTMLKFTALAAPAAIAAILLVQSGLTEDVGPAESVSDGSPALEAPHLANVPSTKRRDAELAALGDERAREVAPSIAPAVAENEDAPEDTSLETFPFRGQILNVLGEPAANVAVRATLRRSKGNDTRVTATTDAAGAFALERGLPACELALEFLDATSEELIDFHGAPVPFPFEEPIATTLGPTYAVVMTGEVPEKDVKIRATLIQPEQWSSPVVRSQSPYVRLHAVPLSTTTGIHFRSEDGLAAGLAELPKDTGRPIEVELTGRGVLKFTYEGVPKDMMGLLKVERADAQTGARGASGPVTHQVGSSGSKTVEHLEPGTYAWSIDLLGVERSGTVAVSARETQAVDLGSFQIQGLPVEILIDATAARDADLSRWQAFVVDIDHPLNQLMPSIERTGAENSGLWKARVDDLPPGNWVFAMKPQPDYAFDERPLPVVPGETSGPVVVTRAEAAREVELRVVDASTKKPLAGAKLWSLKGTHGDSHLGKDGVFDDVPVAGGEGTTFFAAADGYDMVSVSLISTDIDDVATIELEKGNRRRVWVVDVAKMSGADGVAVTIDGKLVGETDETGTLWFDQESVPKRIRVGAGQEGIEILADPFELGISETLLTPGYIFVIKR